MLVLQSACVWRPSVCVPLHMSRFVFVIVSQERQDVAVDGCTHNTLNHYFNSPRGGSGGSRPCSSQPPLLPSPLAAITAITANTTAFAHPSQPFPRPPSPLATLPHTRRTPIMCQIVCQIVACASMRIVVSQVCGLLSFAYSATFLAACNYASPHIFGCATCPKYVLLLNILALSFRRVCVCLHYVPHRSSMHESRIISLIIRLIVLQ